MIRGEQIEIDNSFSENTEINQLIEPYKDSLSQRINEVLCFSPKVLSRRESPLESSLGNFYADACFEVGDSISKTINNTPVDFALFNYGGIRTAIPKGEVLVKDAFNLMPFENKLVIVTLSGSKTLELFRYLQKSQSAHPVSGLRLEMKNDSLVKILIQNRKFDPNKNYRVVTHDYLQKGGDNMSFFKAPEEIHVTELKVRDVLIDALRKIDTLKVSMDNRFIKID